MHRLLSTLAQRGYVQQSPRSRNYTLGLRVFDLYDSLQGKLGLQEICRPFLAKLVELTGETSHLAVLSGTSITFVDWFTSPHMVSARTQIGRQEPVYCTALGQAILACMPPEDLRPILDHIHLRPYTSGTPTAEAALLEELEKARKNGYAVDDEGFLEGVRCVGAPVLDYKGYPVAAMGIAGPATRVTRAACRKLGPIVVDQATMASKALGYRR